MPFNAPGSLSDDDVYSAVAYVLSEAKFIKPTDTMDAKTLPTVAVPNKDGFEPGRSWSFTAERRPETSQNGRF